MDKIEQAFLEELENKISLSIHKGFKETIICILSSVKAEGELYQTLFSENGDRHFPAHIFSFCYKKYSSTETNRQFQNLKPFEKRWLFYFIAQGCSGILSQWIENGMLELINEVADFADKLIQAICIKQQSPK